MSDTTTGNDNNVTVGTPTSPDGSVAASTPTAAKPTTVAAAITAEEVTRRDLTETGYYVLIDKSGSMRSFWQKMQESTLALVGKANEYGGPFHVVFFSGEAKLVENVQPSSIENLFVEHEPNGGTNTLAALSVALQHWEANRIAGTGKRHTLMLVFTDGIPDSGQESAIQQLIVETSKKLNYDSELAIMFNQVGDDALATEFLQRMDNLEVNAADPNKVRFDIVDTNSYETWTSLSPSDLLVKAFND